MSVASFVIAFVGFAALVVLHEAGHFAAAKAVGMRVERFALFFPPLLVRKQVGETEYAIGAVPLGGYVRISGMNPSEELPDEVRTRAYHAQPVWKRIVVIAAGPLVNFVVAFVLLLVFFWQIGPEAPTDRVESVAPGLPAAGAIEPGDRIVAIDGRSGPPIELSRLIARHRCPDGRTVDGCRAGEPVEVVVERPDGSRRSLELTPVYDEAAGRTRLGFSYAAEADPLPFAQAASLTASRFWLITREAVKLPLYVFDPVKREQISGVVGSYETTRQAILNDPGDAVAILAIISLSLAVINLFPFLPLDGGHIFWALVERLRGRPVSLATMERAGVVGIMLLIPLMLIGLTNDVERLLGPGFGPPQ